MKKFIVVKSGKEIKLGDNVILKYDLNTCFSNFEVNRITPLTESILKKLIKEKKVKVVNTNSISYKEVQNNVLTNLSKKTGWNYEQLNNNLEIIGSVNPWAAIQLVLKEIAIELDKKYKDHISKSEEIYVISPQDGKIHKINKETIKDYKVFPAFRNVEDAKIACSLIREKLKYIFANV